MRKWIDLIEGKLLESELLNERAPAISDEERGNLIDFLMNWLGGSYMGNDLDASPMWARINELFPPRLSRPIRLMRLVTLPIEYADMREFDLAKPAPKAVGSWTSTHFGLESVHAIANEIKGGSESCRIAISAMIEPQNVLASQQSLKRAFLTLAHDYEYSEQYEIVNRKKQRDGSILVTTDYKPYLGKTDNQFHGDLDHYLSLFRDWKGGPMRQYEYIVRTTPLKVRNIRVYRKGDETFHDGHDDPHNSGDYRGYTKPWNG